MGECHRVTPGVVTSPSHAPGQDAKFLICQQKYLETLEVGDTTSALQILREELVHLCAHSEVLHTLSR